MDQTIGMIIFAGIIVLVLITLLVSNRQREKLLEQLAEMAGQRGWQFEKKVSKFVDCVIRGQYSDIRWELKFINHELAHSGTNSQNAETITWVSTNAAARDGAVIFYPRLGRVPANAAPESLAGLGMLAMQLLNSFFRASGIDISRSVPQNAGTLDFQRKYISMAPEGTNVQVIASAIETQLGNWPETKSAFNLPAVIIDASGVTVRVVRTSTSTDFQYRAAELIIPIGIAVVSVLK